MLARASSDASSRLRRSKSTSTVQWHPPPIPEPLDPEVAQRHALAAATTAYARSREHDTTDHTKKRSAELSRAKSSSSRKSLTSQGSHFPPRESSFRALNPQRPAQVAGTQCQSRAPAMATEKFPSFYPTPGSDRPLSAQPSIAFGENLRPNSQPKSHRQSAASSVTSQQIRKARSMYYASSVQTGSPIARPPAKYLTTPPPMRASPAPDVSPGWLQARAIAPSPLASPQLPVTVGPGETIDKARDKYLQDFQQRQVKHKPSLFLAPFKKRQDRKKKTRPTSAGIIPVSSENRQTSNDGRAESLDDFGMPKQHKKEKRSFSNSLKDKFKKVFRRSSNNATTLPVQQIEASRDYFSYQAAQHEQAALADRNFDIPSPDGDTLLRARSRTPTLERAPSPFVRPGSHGSNRSRGSNRSLHSETNATHPSSRATSWSDSSAGNTLTQRDVKRLTIIHEAKDSIGSESDRRMSTSSLKRKSLPIPTLAAFRDPMPMESLMEEGNSPIDPKRVFSALMKEIDGPKTMQAPTSAPNSSPGAVSDVFESSATKELHIPAARELRSSTSSDQRPLSRKRPNTAHSKASSIKSFGRALKSTIRTVTPPEAKSSPGPDRTMSVRGDVRIPRPDTAGSESTSSKHEDGGDGSTFGSITFRMHSGSSRPATRDSQPPEIGTPSAEQIEKRVARSKDRWKTPLDVEHIPVVERPHNRTLSGADIIFTNTPKTAVGLLSRTKLESDSREEIEPQVTPARRTPRSPQARQLFSPLSPSIYSRNTDGMSILPNDSVMSFEGANDDCTTREGGSAVIVPSHAVKSYTLGTPSPERGRESNRSSRDWKAWLSHEVSELDTNAQSDYTFQGNYTPTIRPGSPTPRHRREYTQIEEDDTKTVIVRQSIDIVTPRQEFGSGCLPVKHSVEQVVKDPAKSPQNLPSTSPLGRAEPPVGPSSARNLSPPPTLSSVPRTQRLSSLSSAFSQHSSASTSTNSTPTSARMNERFPFINTNRSSSSHSAKLRRTSRTPTGNGSGSSSLKSKTTPSPKVYSDFSVPGTHRTSKYEPNTRSKRSEEVLNNSEEKRKESRKENVTPTTQIRRFEQTHSRAALSLPITLTRPKSMLPLSSVALNRSPSTLSRYTTTAENGKRTEKHAQAAAGLEQTSQQQRLKGKMHPISPSMLTARSRSTFDLRAANTPPSLADQANTSTSTKNDAVSMRRTTEIVQQQQQRTHTSSRSTGTVGLDTDTLRMLLESLWAVSGAPPSPRTSLELAEAMRPKIRVKHSSSTLALNKEPSPGLEERIIDSILVCEEKAMSVKSGVEGSVTGRGTPGQRMAERFLRERSAPRGSGAGSPVDVFEESLSPSRNGSEGLKREDTPAFL